jgi:hypothetical protein
MDLLAHDELRDVAVGGPVLGLHVREPEVRKRVHLALALAMLGSSSAEARLRWHRVGAR